MTRRALAPFAAAALLSLAGLGACVRFVARPFAVAGPSMEPTLREGDRVLVDIWSYRRRLPREGEVAVVAFDAALPRVKRIASAPIRGEGFDDLGFVVLGDNPAHSDDSRRFGPVPRERIRGRVFFRYWPPSRAGAIR